MQIVAFILINTGPGKAWDVSEAVSKMEGVKMAYAVTGPFDVIAYTEVIDIDALKDLITKIHDIKGTQRTQTAISVQGLKPESMFS